MGHELKNLNERISVSSAYISTDCLQFFIIIYKDHVAPQNKQFTKYLNSGKPRERLRLPHLLFDCMYMLGTLATYVHVYVNEGRLGLKLILR